MIRVLYTHQKSPPLVVQAVPSARAFQELLGTDEGLIELAPQRFTREVTAFVRPYWWARGKGPNLLAAALLGTSSSKPAIRGPVLFVGAALEGRPDRLAHPDIPNNFLAHALRIHKHMR